MQVKQRDAAAAEAELRTKTALGKYSAQGKNMLLQVQFQDLVARELRGK
jgi:hypothetical protein